MDTHWELDRECRSKLPLHENRCNKFRRGSREHFVRAHVPAAMLADRANQACNGESGSNGWMREGAPGLFGINALDTVPHPDGDGLLIIGSACRRPIPTAQACEFAPRLENQGVRNGRCVPLLGPVECSVERFSVSSKR